VYFHTNVTGWFNYGPLKTLKSNLQNNGQGHGERYLAAFHAVHMGYTAKTFNGSIFDCSKRGNRNLPIHYHDSIVHLLRQFDHDPQFCVKIVSSLPKEITEKYYQERNNEEYEIPLA
jgi:hypothetical protein